MGFDVPALTAALTGALACLLLLGSALHALDGRRNARLRLRSFVATDQPSDVPRDSKRARRRLLPSDRPAWLAGRELPLLMLVVAPMAVQVLTGQVLLTVAATCQVLLFSTLLGQQLLSARRMLLDNQTLPTVMRMAATMRAGGSLGQAIEAMAQEGPPPTRDEFAQAVREIKLGTSIDAALDRLAARVGTADYAILAHVLTVQRRVGGNLPLVLDGLADTIRARIDVRKQVASLTAQQRLSTWVLVALPYLVLVLFMFADRSFLLPLFTTDIGQILLLAAAVLQTVGGYSLRLAGRIPT